jgi:hypothetical protein
VALDFIGSRYTHIELASDFSHAALTGFRLSMDFPAQGSYRVRKFPSPHCILPHKFSPSGFHCFSGRCPLEP